MWAVIDALGASVKLQTLIHSTYKDIPTTIHDGLELNVIYIEAGIKQGCPLSITFFAIAVDPVVSSHLADVTLRSARTCLFADDVALVLKCIRLQVGPLLARMDRWRKPTGLTLKVAKCVVIALVGSLADYETVLAREPRAARMRVVSLATYLGGGGVEVGPGSVAIQLATVQHKLSARVPDKAAAPSMVGRLVFFSTSLRYTHSRRNLPTRPKTSASSLRMHSRATRNRRGKLGRRVCSATSRDLATHLRRAAFNLLRLSPKPEPCSAVPSGAKSRP